MILEVADLDLSALAPNLQGPNGDNIWAVNSKRIVQWMDGPLQGIVTDDFPFS